MKQFFRRLIAATLCCAASLSTVHAQKCKYVKELTDPFSKQTTRTAQMAIGPTLAGWEVILQDMSGKYYLGLRFVMNGSVAYKFEKGRKIYFKLEDDNTAEVEAKKTYDPVPIQFLGGQYTNWLVIEEVPFATFQKLAASRIVGVKSNLTGEDFLLNKITEKQTNKIREVAACMIAGS